MPPAAWTRAHVEGRVIVLVDDVSTTGATLDECAMVLRAAGARDVRAVVVARTLLYGGREEGPEGREEPR
jgi:predicted amidophosphoribosyltransferase